MADVSNVGGNQPIINLKKTGKKLDLNKLVGLQITDKNASIFDGKYDLNGDGKVDSTDKIDANSDGVINQEEATVLQNLLKKLAGDDNEATAKDFKNLNVGNKDDRNTYFNALGALADQQAALAANTAYTDGNETISNYSDSSGSGVSSTVTNGDIETQTITYSDGQTITRVADKSTGKSEVTSVDGDTTTVTTYETVDGKSRITSESVIGISESGDAITTYLERTYNEDGNYTELKYDGYEADTDKLIEISTEGADGTIKYTVQDELEEGVYRCIKQGESSSVYNITLSSNGLTITAVDADQTTENTPQAEVASEENPTPTAPQETIYTVEKNDSLWKIAAEYLGEGATPGEINKAMHAIAGANGLTIKNKRCMIRPGDQLKIPAELNKTGDTGATAAAGSGATAGADGTSQA